MHEEITYCINHNCKKKYKCKKYRNIEIFKGNEFWFDKLDPKYCGEGK